MADGNFHFQFSGITLYLLEEVLLLLELRSLGWLGIKSWEQKAKILPVGHSHIYPLISVPMNPGYGTYGGC